MGLLKRPLFWSINDAEMSGEEFLRVMKSEL